MIWALTTIVAGSVLLSAGCSDHRLEPKTTSQTTESWDSSNRPSLMGARTITYDQLTLTESKRGSLNFKPWKSSYWPYTRKNIAHRYLAGTDFLSLSDQIASASIFPTDPQLSPAEKYDLIANPQFELTSESWKRFDDLYARYGSDFKLWDWMGICAGWAPASVSEPEPRRHVLVNTAEGREVLFFSGDIRALLSKAYDINATEKGHITVGLRCNENEFTIPRDEKGRVVDGKLTALNENFTILSDYSDASGAVEVTRDPANPESYWLVADKPFRRLSGSQELWQYRTREDVAADLQEGVLGRKAVYPAKQEVIFFKGCRDINPASLHMSLVSNLSEAAPVRRGFIVEISQAQEVWNHPVWGFTSKIQAPKLLALSDPEERVFRAPGATHTVEVETRLVYGSGARPAFEYREAYRGPIDWQHFTANPRRYEFLVLKYSLEMDENGVIIGGEWDKSMDRLAMVPDFYWMVLGKLTDQNKNGNPSILKYSLLQQINACSQRATDTTREVWIGETLQTVPAVTCQL